MHTSYRVRQPAPQHIEIIRHTNNNKTSISNRSAFQLLQALADVEIRNNFQHEKVGDAQGQLLDGTSYQLPTRQCSTYSTPTYLTQVAAQATFLATILSSNSISLTGQQVTNPRAQIISLANQSIKACEKAQAAMTKSAKSILRIPAVAQMAVTPLLSGFKIDVQEAQKNAREAMSACGELFTSHVQCQLLNISLCTSDASSCIYVCQQVLTALGMTMQAITDTEQHLSANMQQANEGLLVSIVTTNTVVASAQNAQSFINSALLQVNAKDVEIRNKIRYL